jgi:4-carboxymuconolactone decarboxylase
VSERYDEGTRVRREVLGDAHVERATAASGIDADFQRWLTETAWGGLWARDEQLDRRTRSCVTIALLTALRAEGELALHVRAGRRNGLTPAEIAEVIMHTAGYAGIPAANAAMAIAKQVLADPEA